MDARFCSEFRLALMFCQLVMPHMGTFEFEGYSDDVRRSGHLRQQIRNTFLLAMAWKRWKDLGACSSDAIPTLHGC